MPRVSVVIPTYNCAHFLGRAIDSALAQTFIDREVVVADDGSTDETKSIIDRYGTQVRYFYQPNRGLSSARNLAIANSTGEYLAYLDADDKWYADKLEKQVQFLDTHPECGFVHSDVTVIDDEDAILYRAFNCETKRPIPQGACLQALLRTSHIQVPSVLERRSMFYETGPFDERLRSLEDYSRWILIVMHGAAVGYLDEPLAYYRWRSGSMSRNQRRMLEAAIMMFDILFREHDFEMRCGPEAVAIVHQHLYQVHRELVYLDIQEAQYEAARLRTLSLLRKFPSRVQLYLDWICTYLHAAMRAGVRATAN
jgi:glycosyltransferase involved in cell wall biosynthesis